MNELLVRPFPIRKIKNNYLRRLVMIISFPFLWAFAIIVNVCYMPFYILIRVCRCSFVLGGSIVEFWNKPEEDKS